MHRAILIALAALVVVGSVGCSSEDTTAPPQTDPVNQPLGKLPPPATQAPLVIIDPASVGPLPPQYCTAFLGLDKQYGPLDNPSFLYSGLEEIPKVMVFVREMYDSAPPELQSRLTSSLNLLSKLETAVTNGTIKDLKTFQDWSKANIKQEEFTEFVSMYHATVKFSSARCGSTK